MQFIAKAFHKVVIIIHQTTVHRKVALPRYQLQKRLFLYKRSI